MTHLPEVLAILQSLAAKRKIFHAEKDFQHALAWEMRLHGYEVRLEYKPRSLEERAYLDLWTRDHNPIAIELKYRTCRFSTTVDGEMFELTNQSAGDHGRYDLWRDVSRLERVVATGEAEIGYAVFLTNDSSYWRLGRGSTADAHYRLNEGRTVAGTLQWAANTGAGTMKGRENPICLRNCYGLKWHDYSDISVPRGKFRFLFVTVKREDAGGKVSIDTRSV